MIRKYNNKFTIFFNIIGFLLFIISYYFYYLSLQKCLKGDNICSQKWDWIKTKIIQLIHSTFIIIILLILIFHNLISKFHIIHFLLTFTAFYYYSHSIYFHDHGAYNLIAFLIVVFLVLILLFILRIILLIFKNKHKYKIIAHIFLFLFYITLKNPINCLDWPKGLNKFFLFISISSFSFKSYF